jgi:gamma-glutamylcyclotransferase (GGCT)/AIG2-like uncharacterized protein YtfP
MEKDLDKNVIPLFVFGTLMKNQKFSFYLRGTEYLGRFYTQGQLMKAPNSSVYIDKKFLAAATFGELYLVNYYCLQRINHLEGISGEFPVGYEIALTRIWPFKKDQKIDFSSPDNRYAFFYRRKNKPIKILTGDYKDDFDTLEELKNLIISSKEISTEEIIRHMLIKMSIWDYE